MKIRMQKTDFSNLEIIKCIEANKITVIETNCYQGQQELIKSLLNGLLINPLYFVEDSEGNYSVLDGNWRLSHVVNYMKSQLFLDLSPKEQRRLEDYLWPVHIIPYYFDRTEGDINEMKNIINFNWRNL